MTSLLKLSQTVFLLYWINIANCQDLIEFSCDIKSDCEKHVVVELKVSCLEGKCSCLDINGRIAPCKPKNTSVFNLIGGHCPCNMENSQCDPKANTCLCKEKFIASNDKRRCIKRAVKLNAACENTQQCMEVDHFSECDPYRKVCICQSHHTEYKGICYSLVNLEESCDFNAQCHENTENSICIERKCACTDGYVAKLDKRTCLPNAGHNDPCVETNQCKHKLGTGSECYSGKCSCDENHYKVITKGKSQEIVCERKIAIGDYCTEHNECYTYELNAADQPMECILSECRCRNGFIQHDKICLSEAAVAEKSMLLISILLILLLCTMI